MQMLNRRNNTRNLCSDIVELCWNDESGWPLRTHAVIEDIGDAGACLQSEIRIPVGSDISIQLGSSVYEAKVRYCTLIDHGYFVGAEFVEGTRWSPGTEDPKHLFQPQHQLN
jgi:hypothetical protein